MKSVLIYDTIIIVEAFTITSEDNRRFILDSLETIHLNLSALKNNPGAYRKISRYMEMISKCKEIKQENLGKFSEMFEEVALSSYIREYTAKLERARDDVAEKMTTFLPKLITLDFRDWYLMMLVQILNLKDRGRNSCYDGYVRDKVYALVSYMEKLKEENKDL